MSYLDYESIRDFSTLVGKEIVGFNGLHNGSERVELILRGGGKAVMAHIQDCCESVELIDVIGDVDDVIGVVVDARVETSDKDPEGVPAPKYGRDSCTWTFYILQTRRGCITMRWLGESNGYYSESVDFFLDEEQHTGDAL